MTNIIGYAASAEETFTQKPLGEVDSLVFSQLSYLNFESLVPGPAHGSVFMRLGGIAVKRNYDKLLKDVLDPKNNKKLLDAVSDSPRFKDVGVCCYSNILDYKKEQQFSAVTFILRDTLYVAFRGTDITVLGWKEDFNMAYTCPVPSQEEGKAYLEQIAAAFPKGKMYLGGHSKGGNIAVYAALCCSEATARRIINVFSHDGPGFRKEMFSDGRYDRVKSIIRKTIPQSSVIGMLLTHREDYRIVKSKRVGIFQHDPFSWRVEGDKFKYLESIKGRTEVFNQSLNDWLEALDDDTRRRFISNLFLVISASGAKTVLDFSDKTFQKASKALLSIKEMDKASKEPKALLNHFFPPQ